MLVYHELTKPRPMYLGVWIDISWDGTCPSINAISDFYGYRYFHLPCLGLKDFPLFMSLNHLDSFISNSNNRTYDNWHWSPASCSRTLNIVSISWGKNLTSSSSVLRWPSDSCWWLRRRWGCFCHWPLHCNPPHSLHCSHRACSHHQTLNSAVREYYYRKVESHLDSSSLILFFNSLFSFSSSVILSFLFSSSFVLGPI